VAAKTVILKSVQCEEVLEGTSTSVEELKVLSFAMRKGGKQQAGYYKEEFFHGWLVLKLG
jgi:hypothetical protein